MEKNTLFWSLFTILIVAIVFVIALFIINKEPTPFTELYFYNPESLPSELYVGQEESFTFIVINQENEPKTYDYSVIQESHIGSKINEKTLDSGSFDIISGDYRVISLNFNLEESVKKSKIIVSISGQEIYFWVTSL